MSDERFAVTIENYGGNFPCKLSSKKHDKTSTFLLQALISQGTDYTLSNQIRDRDYPFPSSL
jgi:hypothetical protein